MFEKRIPRLFAVVLALLTCAANSWGQAGGASPESIMKKVAEVYARASSYQDTGVVLFSSKDYPDRSTEPIISFKTYFARPQSLRFEWFDSTIDEQHFLVSDGKGTLTIYNWRTPQVQQEWGLRSAVAGASGISRGAAYWIPSLLIKELGGFRLTELSRLTLLRRESFENNDCHVIQGSRQAQSYDLWIGSKDFLLRRIVMKGAAPDGEDQVEIRRNIKLNETIPVGVFNDAPQMSAP